MGVEDAVWEDPLLTQSEVLEGQPKKKATCAEKGKIMHRLYIGDHELFTIPDQPSNFFCYDARACPYKVVHGAANYCMVPERLFPPPSDD